MRASWRMVRLFLFVPLLGVLLVGPTAVRAEEPECTDCHDTEPVRFADTVHGFLGCVDCHAGAAEMPHVEAELGADCAVCHADVGGEWAASVHGRSRGAVAGAAPDCADCHGAIHELRPLDDPESPVHPSRLPATCGACHADPALVEQFGIPLARPMEAYEQSVHARAVLDGRGGAACSDCHDSHRILRSNDAESPVYHARVPETCGRCHEEITASFRRSVHGAAATNGVREAPVCTDCHGEHRILSPEEPASPAYPTHISVAMCGRCHGDLRLNEKYGLSTDRVPAYEDSYHGLASRSGAQTVAHCASCHGVHDILPSSDPESHVHQANLAATCGACHPGAGERFAIGPVHILATEARFAVVYWIRALYLPLIVFTLAGMILHNVLDLARKRKSLRSLAKVTAWETEERMSVGFRVAHGLVMVTFVLLVYTGFALKYPEGWWAQPLLTWEGEFGLRGLLHRVAAVGLLIAVVLHAGHVAVDRRARRCIAAMMPGLGDVREFRHRMLFYLGLRSEPPHGVRVSYIEKVEYLAFLWGMAIMTGTGFVLWFENQALRWLPTWAIDASTAVHFYEAILASLAILVWHGYWVVFDPAVYPMDWSWWSGRSPVARERERTPIRPGMPARRESETERRKSA